MIKITKSVSTIFLAVITLLLLLIATVLALKSLFSLDSLLGGSIAIVISFLLVWIKRKNRLYSLSLLLISLVVLCFIGYKAYFKYYVFNNHTIEWTGEIHTTTIPFFVHPSGHIYLEAGINTEKKYLLFDTGMDYTGLHEKYNTDKSHHKVTTKSSQSRKEDMSIYRLNKLSFGSISIKELNYGAMKKEVWESCGIFNNQDSIGGILGNDVIDNFVWDLDMVNRKMRISNTPFIDSIAKTKILPLLESGMSWKIPLKINGKKKKIKLDSGSSSILNISDSVQLAKTYTYPIKNIKHGLGIFSYKDCYGNEIQLDSLQNSKLKEKQKRKVFANLNIADVVYKNAFIMDNSKSNLLGIPLFWEYERVILDFPSEKIYLIRPVKKQHEYGITTNSKQALVRTKVDAISQSGYYEIYNNKPIIINTISKGTNDTVIFSLRDKVRVYGSIKTDYEKKVKNVNIDSIFGKGYSKNLKTRDSIYSEKLRLNIYENTILDKNDLFKKL